MRKFSSAIINQFIYPHNVFSCEYYSEEYVWGMLLSTGTEIKIKINNLKREATLEEMAKAFEYRYKGRNRICGKNQSITDNM